MNTKTIAIIAIAAVAMAGIAAFTILKVVPDSMPGHAATPVIEGPNEGSRIDPNEEVYGHIDGYKAGDRVVVWISGVNYAVPVDMDGSYWSWTHRSELTGQKTLNFAVVRNGDYGASTDVTYRFAVESGGVEKYDGPLVTDDWVAPARVVFQPVEKGIRAAVHVVKTVSHEARGWLGDYVFGQGQGDLDGNGVPDQWQGNPAGPSSIVSRVPYVNLILMAAIVVGVPAGILVWQRHRVASWIELRGVRRHERALLRLEARRNGDRGVIRGFTDRFFASKDAEVLAKAQAFAVREQTRLEALRIKGGLIKNQQENQAKLQSQVIGTKERLGREALQAKVTALKARESLGREALQAKLAALKTKADLMKSRGS